MMIMIIIMHPTLQFRIRLRDDLSSDHASGRALLTAKPLGHGQQSFPGLFGSDNNVPACLRLLTSRRVTISGSSGGLRTSARFCEAQCVDGWLMTTWSNHNI